MFGVIICPKCHRARGVSLTTKKAKCSHCGHAIDVSLARVYHKTESHEELVLAVQRMTEKLAINIEDYPAERKRRAKAPVVPSKRGITTEEDLRHVISELSSAKGEFGAEDLVSRFGMGEGEALEIIQRLLEAGMVYEPSAGRFRALSP